MELYALIGQKPSDQEIKDWTKIFDDAAAYAKEQRGNHEVFDITVILRKLLQRMVDDGLIDRDAIPLLPGQQPGSTVPLDQQTISSTS